MAGILEHWISERAVGSFIGSCLGPGRQRTRAPGWEAESGRGRELQVAAKRWADVRLGAGLSWTVRNTRPAEEGRDSIAGNNEDPLCRRRCV